MNLVKRNAAALIFMNVLVCLHPGCTVVQQAEQMKNLINCEFRIVSVENLTLSGINVQKIKSLSELSLMDAGRIMTAVTGSDFPLAFTLNLEARNPNTATAAMNQLEWILFIDDIQMVNGAVNRQVTIPPNNGTAVIPLQLNINLKKVLQGKSADALINFGLNLAGAGNKPTRFMAKLKPTIMIGGYPIVYPGYITIRTEYSSH